MKYQLVNAGTPNAMRLQSIGFVLGTPASNVKKGDFLMWNFGIKSEVVGIIKETKETVTILERCSSGVYERKMTKKRLICILSED